MSYKTVLVGLFTDKNDTWQIDWPTEKELRVELQDAETVFNDHDKELVRHLQGFEPAYEYLCHFKRRDFLVERVFQDMKKSEVVGMANESGLFCAECENDAVDRLEKEGLVIGLDVLAEQKAGNMYAEECKALVKKIVEVEGWDALYRLIEHKDFMTHATQPVLL